MTRRTYTKKPPAGFDSRQEQKIAARYPQLTYHPTNPIFYTQDLRYCPDFFWGEHPTLKGLTGNPLRVYLEVKEWFPHIECAKYIAVADSNPGLYLVVITPKMLTATQTRLDCHPRIETHIDLDTLPNWMIT